MTQQEVLEMLALMKVAWPNFYARQNAESLQAAARMWCRILSAEHPEVVMCALDDCIKTSAFPPVPADIMKRVQAMRDVDRLDASEAFAALKKAAKRGLYHAEEGFAALPAACQEYLGGPSALRDLAMLDENALETVTRGQFMRQYEGLVERQRVRAAIPERVMALIAPVVEKSGDFPPGIASPPLASLPGGGDEGKPSLCEGPAGTDQGPPRGLPRGERSGH